MDASSNYQDSLPTSSDALLARLEDWGLPYHLHYHIPLQTVEDAKAIEHELFPPGERIFHDKNLYLRDRRKRNYLVTVQQDRSIDLKALGSHLEAGKLSFGSSDRLFQNLGVRPGAVSPLAMINGAAAEVQFYLDEAVKASDAISMHPLVNDRTLVMACSDLFKFLERLNVRINWLSAV